MYKILLISLLLISSSRIYAYEFKEYPIVIGCINKQLKIEKPLNEGTHGCDLGKNWSKIYLPSKIIYNELKKVLIKKDYIINILPIINHESQFDINAKGKNKWGYDCGLGQIRDIYGGCGLNLQEQIKYINKKFSYDLEHRCTSWTGDRKIRCGYNRWNGQITGFNGYSNKLMALREFYINYFK